MHVFASIDGIYRKDQARTKTIATTTTTIATMMAMVARTVSLQTSIGKFGINVRLILTPHFLFALPSWLDRRMIYEHT